MFLYVIRNTLNGMEYVGTTTQSLGLRMSGHRYSAKRGIGNSPLYEAIRQYGIEHFTMECISRADTYEELLRLEQAAIQDRATLHPQGYNLVKGGRGNHGWQMRTETRRKIAARATGRVGSMLGRTMSNESRVKMSIVRKGLSTPALLAARRRNGSNPESRRKISVAAKARWATMSCEARTVQNARLAKQ